MKYLISLTSLVLFVGQSLVQVQALRGCENFVTRSTGALHRLEKATKSGSDFRCDYKRLDLIGSNTITCNYGSGFGRISSTSSGSCPIFAPLAPYVGKFLIKAPTPGGTPHCATILGTPGNGAKVGMKACDQSDNYAGQAWTFDGQYIRQDSLCLDVKGGGNFDGNKLQVWTCSAYSKNSNGDANRKFNHANGDFILVDDANPDRFIWDGKNKCVDRPGNSVADGKQLEIWTCGSNNPNQKWSLEVVTP